METPTRIRQQPPRRRQRRKRRKKRARLFVFCFLLFSFVIGLSAIGYASWRVNQAVDTMIMEPSMAEASQENGSDKPADAVKEEGKDTFTVLILGRDHRPESGTNLTDVMIVAAVDQKSGKVSMVSIPRDTKVRLPDIGRRVKANEAFNLGEHARIQAENDQRTPTMDGPALAKQMAGNLFDVEIDHYILVDFKSFMAIVDSVGGITVNVQKDMVYNDPTDGTHINLQAGIQHLSGKKALDWVRHRHDDRGTEYFSSDFDRNRRQQEAIKAIAEQLSTWQGFTHIFEVMDAMAAHIKTDLTKEQIKNLAWNFKALDMSQIKSIETPHVYWDSSSLQTVIPEEDLKVAHQELEAVLQSGKRG